MYQKEVQTNYGLKIVNIDNTRQPGCRVSEIKEFIKLQST